jgi:hypothetical protein
MKIKNIDKGKYGNYYIYNGYLHSDGVVRSSVLDEKTNEYTGYFKTKEEAERALKVWEKKELARLKRKYSKKKTV